MRLLRVVHGLTLLALSSGSIPATAAAVDQCQTIGRRVYELCMASPDADANACLREYDEAYLRCTNPPEAAPATESAATKRSRNVYRIPYATGTKVDVSRDFDDHNPHGKIDMHGAGGGPHRIVAAAAGTIRFIVDSNSQQQHPLDWLRRGACVNNYVWIEHANGEWTKYSHMKQGTTTVKAGLRVGDSVKEGTYLGDEGHVGCAAPAHLH